MKRDTPDTFEGSIVTHIMFAGGQLDIYSIYSIHSILNFFIIVVRSVYMTKTTHKLELRFNTESYKRFTKLYDRLGHTCRAIYNWAVFECLEDDRRVYVQEDGKPYLDDDNHDLARQAADRTGISIDVILEMVQTDMAGRNWHYVEPPDTAGTRYRIEQDLIKRRRAEDWVRECPLLYQIGAIYEGVAAAERSILANSDFIPYIPKGSAAPFLCLSGHAVNRRGNHTVNIPGFTVYTHDVVSKHWEMQSCRLVETMPRNATGCRTFEIHIQAESKTGRYT